MEQALKNLFTLHALVTTVLHVLIFTGLFTIYAEANSLVILQAPPSKIAHPK